MPEALCRFLGQPVRQSPLQRGGGSDQIEPIPGGLLQAAAAAGQVPTGLDGEGLLHLGQGCFQQPPQPFGQGQIGGLGSGRGGSASRASDGRGGGGRGCGEITVVGVAVKRLHQSQHPFGQGEQAGVESIGIRAGGGGLGCQTALSFQLTEQGLDGGPGVAAEAVLHADRQDGHRFRALGFGQVIGGPEGQLGGSRLQGRKALVMAVGGPLRRHGQGIGTIQQQLAGGAQGNRIELAPLDRATTQPLQQPTDARSGPEGNAPVVEELEVGTGPPLPPQPAPFPGQIAPDQVGQASRIIDAGVAKGQQQPAFSGLEAVHGGHQALQVLHLQTGDGALAPQIPGQQAPTEGQHPPIEPGGQKVEGSGGGHGTHRCSERSLRRD